MLIHEITLRGILSFGPQTEPLKMERLNLLVGPNGSGKSNLIEAIGLLRSSAKNLTAPMRGSTGSGVREWIWKGDSNGGHAAVEAIVDNPPEERKRSPSKPLRHRIEFSETSARFELIDETVENSVNDVEHDTPFFFYRYGNGNPFLSTRDPNDLRRKLRREDVALDESVLTQYKDPDLYPELAQLANSYNDIRLYREWSFGRTSVFRSPQSADLPGDRLEEDFSNLGLFLNYLRGIPAAKRAIIEHLQDLYQGLDDFDVRIKGGTVEVVLTEGDFIIPASRLSDGTLRYLCLLAILCDPDPPKLICIEEPELGLHPDLLPKIADLLNDASERTQLVVTTHSDILIDSMTVQPTAVVIVEKHKGQTTTQRIEETDELKEWLKKYRLGELWVRGELGGTRW